MRKNKVRMDLDDRIWGISGTVDPNDYKETVKGMDSSQAQVYVKYKPALKTREALKLFVKRFFNVFPGVNVKFERRTPEPVPVDEIHETYTPHAAGKHDDQDLAGQPDRKLVLKQLEDGRAPYSAEIEEREESTIKRLNQEKNNLQSEALQSGAKATSLGSEDEEKEEKVIQLNPQTLSKGENE